MENKEDLKEDILCRLREKIEEIIKSITEKEFNTQDVDLVGKLVDIHKDISNEKYWKVKEEHYMYGNYGDDSYGRRMRDSRGRFMDGRYPVKASYGRYRGDDYMGEMSDGYGRYMESHSRYGAGKESMESLEYMLQSAYDFMKHISNEASSQEEVNIIREYADKISRI